MVAPPGAGEDGGGGVVGVVVGVHDHGESELLEVGGAGDGARLLAGLRQGGQQHRRQDGDDRDDDEQLDQGEVSVSLLHGNDAPFQFWNGLGRMVWVA